MIKICIYCKAGKDIQEFYSRKGTPGDRPEHFQSCCKSCLKIKNKVYKAGNKLKVNAKNSQYMKSYRTNNPEKKSAWHEKNKHRVREYINKKRLVINEQERARLQNNPSAKKGRQLQHCLNLLVNKKIKDSYVKKYIGISVEGLRSHFESLFTKEMNWNNYGEYWCIDHIKPRCSFDLTNEQKIYECFNYTNLQPLTRIENNKKWKKTNWVRKAA